MIRAACPSGVRCTFLDLTARRIVLPGLVLESEYRGMSRKDKKRSKDFLVGDGTLVDWVHSVELASAQGGERIVAEVDESLAMFHDVTTAVSSILRNAENFVNMHSGSSFDERLERLPTPAISLVKSVHLLQARLQLMPLLSNPEAASYGQKHPMPIYRVVDRLVRIMRNVSESRKLQIELRGSSFNQPMAFDSFETIPLVLIDNAIKYSYRGQRIEVEVSDQGRAVKVAVRSFSPMIPLAERERIFERGHRCKSSPTVSSKGGGIGLFLAQRVANAHGFVVAVSCDESPRSVAGVDYCNNEFYFIVPG